MKENKLLGQQLFYGQYLDDLYLALTEMKATNRYGKSIGQEQALINFCKLFFDIRRSNNTIYFIGNGASATMASHMAADFNKTCGCRATVFNDVALMSAVSNDIHFKECFSVPLNRFAEKGDVLVTISSSGNSANVIAAIKCAREKEMFVITFSGMDSNNDSRKMGDLNFWIPASTYGLVESAHQALLHSCLDTFFELYGGTTF
jgi:D-sedoheptulose 7-phosphate isomerase